MIVRSLDDILGTDADVSGPNWKSRRILLAKDGMGFSLHDTLIAEGASLTLEYKHHLEACYCIAGEGEITNHSDGKTHPIKPFSIYALDQNDRHTFHATKGEVRLVSVFNPPVTGSEVHREDGSYAPAE